MMTTEIAAKWTATLVAVFLACALSTGCANSPVAEAKASQAGSEATAEVAAAPKQLLADVRRVVESPPLSLGVESVDRGTLVTGWKRFQGDWHIARHWQDRTRYRIEVIPDWEDPTGRASLSYDQLLERTGQIALRQVDKPEDSHRLAGGVHEAIGRKPRFSLSEKVCSDERNGHSHRYAARRTDRDSDQRHRLDLCARHADLHTQRRPRGRRELPGDNAHG